MGVIKAITASSLALSSNTEDVIAIVFTIGYFLFERIMTFSNAMDGEWLITYFAAAKIGVVIVGLSIRYRDSELEL